MRSYDNRRRDDHTSEYLTNLSNVLGIHKALDAFLQIFRRLAFHGSLDGTLDGSLGSLDSLGGSGPETSEP